MDKNQAQKHIRDIFQHPFNRNNYQHFLRNLLNQIEPRDAHYTGNLIPESFKEHVTQYWRVGKYIDPDGIELDLLVVEVKSLSKLDRARSALRNFAVNRLKQFEKDCSLVAFYAKDDGGEDWRFSFVKIEHEAHQDDKGKVRLRTELTPAKRYSYLVGVHENSHTACQQLMPLLVRDYANPRVEEIEKAFSIEKVTDEFFEQYKGLYLKLSEQLKSQSFFQNGSEEENTQSVARFAKKLLGQIVFLYFLQKKGWLGVAKDGKWGNGSRRFMRDRFTQIADGGGNYYHDFLQYLFYEALAKERKDQPDPDYYERFSCKIPFLNGGLFEAEYEDWHNLAIDLPNSLFHNDEKNKAGDVGTGILDVFDRYNFTIKEDEPLEKEVAVDPEMLGKVFENMLEITERKSKGAFYTPREIVHYMCQESLIHYLDNSLNSYAKVYQTIDSDQPILFGGLTDKKGQQKLEITHQDGIKVPKEDLETLIRKGHLFVENDEAALQALQRIESGEQKTTKHKIELPESVKSNADKIDNYLASIKACDPAIGSGAFPVGLLHEIVNARLALAPHSGRNLSVYELKRHTIHESLYGVDIDASAVDIARLRLWLSLIVDEDDFSPDKALPNLDYKIVCGNSLIGFPEDWKSSASDKIEQLKHEFFSEKNQEEKAKKKRLIDAEIQARMAGSKKSFGYQVDFDYNLYFSEVWHEKDGFDVVIGNPPYVSHDRLAKEEKNIFKKLFKCFAPFADLYCYFIEKAMKLQGTRGLLTYITSNSYLRAEYGNELRTQLTKYNDIVELINIEDFQVFSTAIVNSSILISTRHKKLSTARIVNDIYKNNKSFLSFVIQDSFIYEQADFKRKSWNLVKPQQLKLLKTIVHEKQTLESLNTKIRLGLATGDNSAFILTFEQRNRLIQKSPVNDEILKPVLRGRDIQRYYYNLSGDYLILSKNGVDVKNDYPDIYAHLDSFGEKFKNRGAKGQHWTNLRACAFFDDFKYEKIVWIELTDKGRFTLCNDEIYLLNSAYFMIPPTGYNPKYLLGVLNSSVIHFFLQNNAETSGLGTTRWINNHVKDFPVPKANTNAMYPISVLVSYLEYQLILNNINRLSVAFFEELVDGLVYELYFNDEIKAANKEILKHLGNLKPITDEMSSEEKLAIIQSEFDRLYDPKHPVRNNLETLDSVEEVRIIREALKK